MADPRVDKLARLLVDYCVRVQPGDQVLLSGHLVTRPLMLATYGEIIRAGGHPLVFWSDSAMQEMLLKQGSDEQLSYIAPPMKLVYETYDGAIFLGGGSNTRALSAIDPARQQLMGRARGDLTKMLMERSAAGEYRWVGTMFPTEAYAQEADMSLADYEDFVYAACFADQPDPIARWNQVHEQQQRLVDWLQGKEQIKVQGPNVDMTLSIAGRTFLNADGRQNMPSGEIFTSPVEDSAKGWIRFTYPAIVDGREVEGIELRFVDGKVVEAAAQKNQEYLLTMLDTDAGARYLGEFAIGTNDGIQRFTKSILFDEKIGGTIHLAVGRGFGEAGGKNQSAIHWDMICGMRDGGQIWVDGELFYDSGQFAMFRP